MKRRTLEKELKRLGYEFLRHGGDHDIWTNGKDAVAVPRHNEVSEYTAKSIIKKAKRGNK